MNLIVTIDEESQDEALAAARKITLRSVSRNEGLPAPVGDNIIRWVDRVWDQIEQALRDAFKEGRDVAQAAVTAATKVLTEAAGELGKRIEEVEALLRKRLDAYLQE